MCKLKLSRVLDRMTDTENADIARAEELIGEVLAFSPSDRFGHFAKGQLLRAQRRCAEAIPEFEAALASNRNWVGAISHIGRCKTRLGLLDEAIALHEQAIRLDPVGPSIAVYYMRIGSARLLQSRVGEAITWLEKARAANPQHPWVRAHLTAAYGAAGEIDRAVVELAEARRLGGDGFLPSIAKIRANSTIMDGPAIQTLAEATYFAGLRAAGVPEE